MLIIRDEQLVKRLLEIAASENCSVEDVLWSRLKRHLAEEARISGKGQELSKTSK